MTEWGKIGGVARTWSVEKTKNRSGTEEREKLENAGKRIKTRKTTFEHPKPFFSCFLAAILNLVCSE